MTTKFDPSEYRFIIQKKAVEGHVFFVGNVAEFPDVEVYEESHQAACDSLAQILTDLEATYRSKGRIFPAPLERERLPSGRVTLRLTKSVHAKAIAIAEREEVSLNQWISSVVAERVGESSSALATVDLLRNLCSNFPSGIGQSALYQATIIPSLYDNSGEKQLVISSAGQQAGYALTSRTPTGWDEVAFSGHPNTRVFTKQKKSASA